MNKKYLQLIIGIAVSLFFIWFAFHAGGVTFKEIGDALKSTNWWWGIPFMVITMASFYWRGFRYQILLESVKKIPVHRLYPPIMIGFAFNNILPARIGEFVRPVALAKSEKVPFGAGLSSVVVERVVDVFVLLFLLIITPYIVTLDPEISRTLTIGGNDFNISASWLESKMPILSLFALILLAGLVSFLIPPIERLYILILEKLPLLPQGIREKLIHFVGSFSKGCDCLKSPKAIVLITIHSLIIWFSVAFTFYMMSWGFKGVEMNYYQSLVFLVTTCVVISIPSSPGYWGIYEFGGMVGLMMMGVVPDTPAGASLGFTFTLVIHFLQWLPITAYGLWAAAKMSISASDAEAAKAMAEHEDENQEQLNSAPDNAEE